MFQAAGLCRGPSGEPTSRRILRRSDRPRSGRWDRLPVHRHPSAPSDTCIGGIGEDPEVGLGIRRGPATERSSFEARGTYILREQPSPRSAVTGVSTPPWSVEIPSGLSRGDCQSIPRISSPSLKSDRRPVASIDRPLTFRTDRRSRSRFVGSTETVARAPPGPFNYGIDLETH